MNFFSRFSGTSDTVGIDIGSHTIKVAQVALTRQGYQLVRAGSTPTPSGAVKAGVVVDRIQVAESIFTLLQTLGIRTTLAISAVAGPTVVVRQVKLPAMPENQLRKSIQWEARNYIPTTVEDSMLEFQILGTSAVDGTPQMDVMMVAAPRDMVESRIAALEQAGLEPLALELEPFALMRSAIDIVSTPGLQQENIALVEIGHTYTHISIVSAGTFILTRSVTVAGESFTQAIMSALSVSADEAEEIKENQTAAVTDVAMRARLSPTGQDASLALESQIEELVREIRRSFAFFDYQKGPDGNRNASGISRVILTGGTARLPGIITLLQDNLGLPIELFSLSKHSALRLPEGVTGLDEQAPMLATSIGLALREPMISRERGGFR
ncbi:MAG: type IV pilus assembly protein PilM [bacterium]